MCRRIQIQGAGSADAMAFACGSCGTDIHLMHDTYPGNSPIITGREFSGVAVMTGPEQDEERFAVAKRLGGVAHTILRIRRNIIDN